MNANTEWTNPEPLHPFDKLDRDTLLMMWDAKKKAIEVAKDEEMELRKYIVSRAFPNADEGTNKIELGQGYNLKAVVKYNYKLADNDTVEKGLDRLSNLGNNGSFIADRLVGWTPSFKLAEYRQLQEDKEKGSKFAADALQIISEFMTITEAAPIW